MAGRVSGTVRRRSRVSKHDMEEHPLNRNDALRWSTRSVLVMVLVTLSVPVAHAQDSVEPAREEFQLVWDRTEAPVDNGDAERSWLWGPEPRTPGVSERYLDSPGEERTVQYFDKGRMEVNDPDADPGDPWFVTSGLLTRELISGQIQIGDDDFLDTGEGASIHVAGDHLTPFPQYRHLAGIVDQGQPDRTGETADNILTPDGVDTGSPQPNDPDAEFVHHVIYEGPDGSDVGYNIPRAFWDYLNAPGTVYDEEGDPTTAEPLFSWIYVMGFPIADPIWVEVPVGGEPQWVLIQPFERRVLTYTPSNSDEWQVEMGNIGQHYRDWRGQYLDGAASGGDPEFFAFVDEGVWRYETSLGVDEVWETIGTSDSFISGHTLFARDEYRLDGLQTTYWSIGEDGLYLHGRDLRDGQRNVRDVVVYSPAIHVLPGAQSDEPLITETTAISMNQSPAQATIEVDAGRQQLVFTPAGVFQTWRVELTGFEDPAVDHGLGETFWFEPEVGIVQWLTDDSSGYLTRSSLLEEDEEE